MKESQASDSAKLGIRSSFGMSLTWPPRALIIWVRVSGVPLFFFPTQDMKVAQEVFQIAKVDGTSVHHFIRDRPLHLHVLQGVRRKDHREKEQRKDNQHQRRQEKESSFNFG